MSFKINNIRGPPTVRRRAPRAKRIATLLRHTVTVTHKGHMDLNRRLPRIDPSHFSMVPRNDVPRSTFETTHGLKTTFNTGYLVPILCEEVLPADVHQGSVTLFARLGSPLLFPLMDNLYLETFFFFVPMRILWANAKKFFGERANPADSISYTIPQVQSANGGFPINTVFDYFGLPTVGQVGGGTYALVNVIPLRAYNLIWNDWFRDQNLQNSLAVSTGDGPDAIGSYTLLKRNKKHDYFTSALPYPQKGATSISLPLSGTAPVMGLAVSTALVPTGAGTPANYRETPGTLAAGWTGYWAMNTGSMAMRADGTVAPSSPQIFADLSSATGATINALRLAVQTQRLLERDARSGTRYTELLRAHFGVTPEDARLQRPEYIGGGQTPIQTSAIPQTSATGLTGGSTPFGGLAGQATAADQHSFSYHATEHGYIIGLASARGEITYQQGLHRMWTRSTRYDFYWPVFANLGEQAIRNDELYMTGAAADTQTFGYQERWAEYRHRPSRITGMFRSTHAGTIDTWHVAQKFTGLPTLNTTFIEESVPMSRVLSAGSTATTNNMEILFDSVFKIRSTRAMPMYSVPGMMDRF